MKKMFFVAVIAIASIGAFAFKAETKSFDYYWKDGLGVYHLVQFETDPCIGTANNCTEIIPGQGSTPKQLFKDVNGVKVAATRD